MLCYFAGLVFFAVSSPDRLPIGLLIFPFIYVFFIVYLTVDTLSVVMGRRHSKFVPLLIAVTTVLILILGSLRQLTARDIALSIVIVSLLSWYISKARVNKGAS
jgi:hypothetical protein